MKKLIVIFLIMVSTSTCSQITIEVTDHIIGLEKAALDRWNNGDIYGYLELTAEDVVYFDPMMEKRLDGLQALTDYYMPIQGLIKVSSYEMVDPKVQAVANMAVLTYNLKSYTEEKIHLWNCTEVYRKEMDGEWKIIQSHWSLTQPIK